jgi:hypothetical protein
LETWDEVREHPVLGGLFAAALSEGDRLEEIHNRFTEKYLMFESLEQLFIAV